MNEEDIPQTNEPQATQTTSCKRNLTTSTQYLAVVLFVMLPFLGFWLGMRYEDMVSRDAVQHVEQDLPETISSSTTPLSETVVGDTFTISQNNNKESLSVQISQYTNQPQSVAQTFTVPNSAKLIESITLDVKYVAGDVAIMSVYEIESNRNPVEGKQLALIPLDLFDVEIGKPLTITFEEPIVVQYGKTYSLVIYVEDDRSVISLGKGPHNTNVYKGGRAWYFSRVVGSNGIVLSNTHEWNPRHDDLCFTIVMR